MENIIQNYNFFNLFSEFYIQENHIISLISFYWEYVYKDWRSKDRNLKTYNKEYIQISFVIFQEEHTVIQVHF